MDVVGYLESKGVQLQQAGSGNMKTHCFFCGEGHDKARRLYVQCEPESPNYGRFICFLCEEKGGLNKLREHFGDSPIENIEKSDAYLRMMNAASEFYINQFQTNEEIFDYLTYERGLSLDTVIKKGYGWSSGHGLYGYLVKMGFSEEDIEMSGLINKYGQDFLRERVIIPYYEYGNVVSLRGKALGVKKGKYLGLPGIESKLYGLDSIAGAETIILCAGEFDQAVLEQLGYAALGVPGERIFKDEWLIHLEDAKRIYIIFDNDKEGIAGSEKLAQKIGPRARVVTLPGPPGVKMDVSKWFVEENKQKEDFDWLLSKSKGGLLISPAQAHERWLEVEGNPDLVGLRFNISELDTELNHGLTPGQIVTLLARTNAGKSIFTLNVLQRMRLLKPDLKVLLLSLEQTRNEWFERAHRLNAFYDPTATVNDTVKWWQDNLYLVDKNRISETELEYCLDQYNFDMGQYPDIVVVDYLGYYAKSYPGEEYQRISSAMMGLKAIAKEYTPVFFVPHQANRSNDLGSEVRLDEGQGSGVVEQTSDLILSLWNPDQKPGLNKEDHKKELLLKVQKSRDGGVGIQFKLQSAPLTLAIVPHSDKLYERALDERQYWIAGDDWHKAVWRHKTGDKKL